MHRQCLPTVTAAVLALIAGAYTTARAGNATDALLDPDPARLDPRLLDDAVHGALRAAVGSLLARQQAPDNGSDLIYPPLPMERAVGTQTVQRRYRRVVVRVPVYEFDYEEVMTPVRDEYGQPKGMAPQRVAVNRRQVGWRDEERLIRDPQGEVVKDEVVPTFEPDGAPFLPHGLHGVNGMALYLLCRAGLKDHTATAALAADLARLTEQTGIPDMTWDQAWLLAGFSQLDDSTSRGLADRLAARLIDGVNRQRGPAEGLWGPVAVHTGRLAALLEMREKLALESARLREQAKAGGEARAAQVDAARARLAAAEEQLATAFAAVSQQGHRMTELRRHFEIGDAFRMPGVPVYVYAEAVGEVEATRVAAFALREAKRHGVVVAQVRGPKLGPREVGSVENGPATLAAALAATVAQQKPDGGWDTTVLWQPVGLPVAGGGGVPHRSAGAINVPRFDTLQSTLDGFAAAAWLAELSGPAAQRHRVALDRARRAATDAVETMLGLPPEGPWVAPTRHWSVPLADLTRANGRLPDAPRPQPGAAAWAGQFAMPWNLLPPALALRPAQAGDDPEAAALLKRLTYRVLVTQDAFGQWGTGSNVGGAGITAGHLALHLANEADNFNAMMLQLPEDQRRDFIVHAVVNQLVEHRTARTPNFLLETLYAAIYLADQTDRPVDLTDAVTLEGPAGEAAGESGRQDAVWAANATRRPNDRLEPLRQSLRQPSP